MSIMKYLNPQELELNQLVELAEAYLNKGDQGAARYYANFAFAESAFEQKLVENKSLIANEDPVKIEEWFERSKTVLKQTKSMDQDQWKVFDELKQQFGNKLTRGL